MTSSGNSKLNKGILDQGWFEFRRQLEYKLQWKGGILLAVDPKDTSRTCPKCGLVSKKNRTTQALFKCICCGYEANADEVGAMNILARGQRVIACGSETQKEAKPVKDEASVSVNQETFEAITRERQRARDAVENPLPQGRG